MTKRFVERSAWAIQLDSMMTGPRWSVCGIYWFGKGSTPPWHDGCRIALFATRAEARTHRKATVRGLKSSVVKVKVRIEAVE